MCRLEELHYPEGTARTGSTRYDCMLKVAPVNLEQNLR